MSHLNIYLHLQLRLPSMLLPSCFSTKVLYAFLPHALPTRHCMVWPTIQYIVKIKYHQALFYVVLAILLLFLYSWTKIHSYVLLPVRETKCHTHPRKTAKITVQCTLVFLLLDSKWEYKRFWTERRVQSFPMSVAQSEQEFQKSLNKNNWCKARKF